MPWSEVGIEPESEHLIHWVLMFSSTLNKLSRKIIWTKKDNRFINKSQRTFFIMSPKFFAVSSHMCFIHAVWKDEPKLNSQSWTNSEVNWLSKSLAPRHLLKWENTGVWDDWNLALMLVIAYNSSLDAQKWWLMVREVRRNWFLWQTLWNSLEPLHLQRGSRGKWSDTNPVRVQEVSGQCCYMI